MNSKKQISGIVVLLFSLLPVQAVADSYLRNDEIWRELHEQRSRFSQRRVDLHKVIEEYARDYRIPAALIASVIRIESDAKPCVIGAMGEQGLMQLMPKTAKEMRVRDRLSPRQNIRGGARYLKIHYRRTNGNLEKTLAAYNFGPRAYKRKFHQLPASTQRYIRKVRKIWPLYEYSGWKKYIPRYVKRYSSVSCGNAMVYNYQSAS